MKRIVRRVQSLNERAAELTAAVGQLPKRVAELRGAVNATSDQLQTFKADIQVNVADLMVDREDDLSAALAEIAGHAPVLAKAGFLLDGFDVEVSPIQRLMIQLVRFEDVDTTAIQALIHQYQAQHTLRAVLSAILKARAMVATIDIDGLDYHKLIIGIGAVPTIRLCWRAAGPATGITSSAWQPTPAQSLIGSSSFFVPPIFASAATTMPAKKADVQTEVSEFSEPEEYDSSATTTHSTHSPPIDELKAEPAMREAVATQLPSPIGPPPIPAAPVDPLARFKVMPNLGREC